jgi:hypothetical protein
MTNLATLTRFDSKDGIEILINESTGESFCSVSGYARMANKDKSTISRRLEAYEGMGVSSVASDGSKNAKAPTPSGAQSVALVTEDLIVEWLPKDNPIATRALLKLGLRKALHLIAGYEHNSTPTSKLKAYTPAPYQPQSILPPGKEDDRWAILKVRNKALPELHQASMTLRSGCSPFIGELVQQMYEDLKDNKDGLPHRHYPQVVRRTRTIKALFDRKLWKFHEESESGLLDLLSEMYESFTPLVEEHRESIRLAKIAAKEAARAAEIAEDEAFNAAQREKKRIGALVVESPYLWIMDEAATDKAIKCPIGSTVGLQGAFNLYRRWCVSKGLTPLKRKELKAQLLGLGLTMQVQKGTRVTLFTFPADRAALLTSLKAIAAAA